MRPLAVVMRQLGLSLKLLPSDHVSPRRLLFFDLSCRPISIQPLVLPLLKPGLFAMLFLFHLFAKPECKTFVHFTTWPFRTVILSEAKNLTAQTLHFVQGDNPGVPNSCRLVIGR